MTKEKCNNTNDDNWMHCQICNCRVHNPDCTTQKVDGKDCLEKHTKEEYKENY